MFYLYVECRDKPYSQVDNKKITKLVGLLQAS